MDIQFKSIAEIICKEVADGNLKAHLQSLFNKYVREFDEKPSSTKYHHVEKGGMGRHICEVMNIALSVYDVNSECYRCSRDEVILAAFVHDFSKLGRYREISLTDWRRQPKYGSQEFEYAEPQVYLDETAKVVHLCALAGLILPDVVINAVTFHHGAWSESAKDNPRAMEQMTPLAVLLHFADMMSVKAFDVK